MLRDSDLIIFSLSRWDAPYSSPSFSLAREFARNNRVFYIDHPFSVKDLVLNYGKPSVKMRKSALLQGKGIYTKSDKFPENLTMVTPRVTLPINFLPPGKIYNKLAGYNDRVIFDTIRQIIRDLM